MRLALPKPFLWPLLALPLFTLSCDKDLVSTEDQPTVDYVVLVTDSATSEPLDAVKIRVTTITGDTATYYTDDLEGRAELATVASSRTLFELTRSGYRALDIEDTVLAKTDTVFNRPVQRLLRARMVNLNPDSGRVQVQILFRNEELERLRRGRVWFTDSNGVDQTVSDHDSDGTVGLTGLPVGKSMVRVQHTAYLGRWVEVGYDRAQDTARRAPSLTVVLERSDCTLSGQVYRKTATTPIALLDAKVEFHLKDTLAYPKVFRTFTSEDVGQNGRFTFEDVPAKDGELWFYKNRTATQRSHVVALTREEVMLDRALPLVTLSLSADSLLPLLSAGPGAGLPGNDTLAAADSLVFKFNQPVSLVQGLKVSLVNGSEIWYDSSWSKDRKQLKVWQREAPWTEGRKYEYNLVLLNAAGETFTIPGDSTPAIQGSFVVRVRKDGVDSNLVYPRNIRFAYFNSGSHFLFGATDTSTSPKADSTSQFARLKWDWTGESGKRVDSLILWYKDNAKVENWSRWGSIPGFLDSAYLSFSDNYSTLRVPSQKDRFPLRDAGGEILFKIIPKHEGRSLDNRDTTLEALNQGMGPTVYVHYQDKVLKKDTNAVDSLEVTFRTRLLESGSAVSWGAVNERPIPRLYFNGELVDEDDERMTWRWTSDKTGQLKYRLPPTLTTEPRLRVDLNGEAFRGKPVWQRNYRSERVLR